MFYYTDTVNGPLQKKSGHIKQQTAIFVVELFFCLRHKVIVVQSHSMLASVPAEAFN